jgi:hypothetical protein
LGLGDLIVRHLSDPLGKNTQLPLTDLMRHPYTAAWPATRMSTTPRGRPKTRPSASSAPGKSASAERR